MNRRLLNICLLTKDSPQTGMRDAMQKFGADGYVEFSWMKEMAFGVENMRSKLVALAKEYKPSLTFIQVQTPDILDGDTLDRIPGFVVNWTGDLRDSLPQWAIDMAPHVDVTCFSNMRDVESLRALGHNSEFLNIGFSGNTFRPMGQARRGISEVLFMGNHYNKSFPCSEKRFAMVAMLKRVFGSNFEFYGRGWNPARPWLDEPTEAIFYRGCKIAIDMNHYDDVPRFFSDRRLRIMASGAFCIANHNPGIEEDFEVGKHLVTFKDVSEVAGLVRYYLARNPLRLQIAKEGCAHVLARHSWDARIKDLFGIMEKYGSRNSHLPPPRKIVPTPKTAGLLKSAVDGWRRGVRSL